MKPLASKGHGSGRLGFTTTKEEVFWKASVPMNWWWTSVIDSKSRKPIARCDGGASSGEFTLLMSPRTGEIR